ncbi:MAG TPA: bifunctional UDP-N-acetylglucosamine diphosphorylase/glucosamine-1-phosphate N-acetyltransferase GlmU [Oscillospiraceae bacterium]|nr:bifunctional UDP-N-acetylglucosamine diphosphorylase/glucosamine-1-phosphate N-acetyltransferase GlmU [Oscillospiraceae bacterium]
MQKADTANTCAIILAAGDGKRMRSQSPKVLNEVLFEPMLKWVISACQNAKVDKLCVVAGYKHEEIQGFLHPKYEDISIAIQHDRKGTAHAVMQAVDFLRHNNPRDTLVLCGDAPFIDEQTITASYNQHIANQSGVTVITARLENPTGYGRIIRNEQGITSIVEQRDCTSNQLAIDEVNSGAYWFNTQCLLDALEKIDCNNAAGEYYLTDAVGVILQSGKKADAYIAADEGVTLGANDRRTLYSLNQIAKGNAINRHFENGVEFVSLDGVIIGREVKIGAGTRILPGVILKGKTQIGENCVLGPNTVIEDSIVGDGTILNSVQAYQSEIGSHVKIGPFVHIRPNSKIHDRVKIGDFVEVKNSEIGEKTSISHLTYVGDSDVGSGVNFGCGVVTVNYDGKNKSRTTIGDNAFIGCNTNLVAPVNVGKGAYTAAGSTITKNIPDDALAIERAQLVIKEGYAKRKLKPKD